MLESFAKHALFDLTLSAKGDLEVDLHHTVEDVGIALGQALRQALGDAEGIRRYGSQVLPMAEAKVEVSVDVSNRAYLVYRVELSNARIGNFDASLTEDFLYALAQNAGLDLHVELRYGKSPHHVVGGDLQGPGPGAARRGRARSARQGPAHGEGRPLDPSADPPMTASPRIAVVDYGAGNLRSVAKALRARGSTPQVTGDPDALRRADAVVLPGVGAFADAMAALRATRPRRGACASRSRAAGPTSGCVSGSSCSSRRATSTARTAGLGLLAGRVERFPARRSRRAARCACRTSAGTRCAGAARTRSARGCRREDYYYFVHSYRVVPADPQLVVGCSRLRRRRSRRRSRATTCSPCSSTPRRARTRAGACSTPFAAWIAVMAREPWLRARARARAAARAGAARRCVRRSCRRRSSQTAPGLLQKVAVAPFVPRIRPRSAAADPRAVSAAPTPRTS